MTDWYNEPLLHHSRTTDRFERGHEYFLLKNGLPDFLLFYNANFEHGIELGKAIKSIVNYFGIICAGISVGLIGKGLVKKYLTEIFHSCYDDWIALIREKRRKSPKVFIELTSFVEQTFEK